LTTIDSQVTRSVSVKSSCLNTWQRLIHKLHVL